MRTALTRGHRLVLPFPVPQEILDVQEVQDTQKGLDLSEENIDMVLDEIRCGGWRVGGRALIG